GGIESQAVVRTSTEARREKAAVDLRSGDTEPAADEVRICLVDARDGGGADQAQIQHHAEPCVGWAATGTTWHHLPEAVASCVRTQRDARTEMAEAGISPHQSACTARKGRDLLRRRRTHPLGSSFRPHLGQERRDPYRGKLRSALRHEPNL